MSSWSDGSSNRVLIIVYSTEVHIIEYAGLRYICKVQFAVLTMVISAILLVAAAATSVILGIIVRTPDTLGFVSTVAKDSLYFNVCVFSRLGGVDVARAL